MIPAATDSPAASDPALPSKRARVVFCVTLRYVLRPAKALFTAAPKPPAKKERLVSPRELRRFLGDPKGSQWKALLERSGVQLQWSSVRAQGKSGWKKRCGLTRVQCLAVMRVRYAGLGEQLIRRWKL